MANREGGLARPKPGTHGGKNPEMKTTTPSWPGAPGPKGKGWGASMSGFKEIREGAAQDKADDGLLPPLSAGTGMLPPLSAGAPGAFPDLASSLGGVPGTAPSLGGGGMMPPIIGGAQGGLGGIGMMPPVLREGTIPRPVNPGVSYDVPSSLEKTSIKERKPGRTARARGTGIGRRR